MTASLRTFASPKYRDNLNTLNIRSNLSALMTRRLCAPGMNILMYVGKMANKSTIPKNEVEYFTECSVEYSRKKYSIVNRIVKNHSNITNCEW